MIIRKELRDYLSVFSKDSSIKSSKTKFGKEGNGLKSLILLIFFIISIGQEGLEESWAIEQDKCPITNIISFNLKVWVLLGVLFHMVKIIIVVFFSLFQESKEAQKRYKSCQNLLFFIMMESEYWKEDKVENEQENSKD